MKVTLDRKHGIAITSRDANQTVVMSFLDQNLNFQVVKSLKGPLAETMRSMIDEGYRNFVLNFEKVKVIDSSGFGLMIVADRTSSSLGANLYLCGLRSVVTDKLNLMRITKFFSIYATEDEALAEVRKSLQGG